MELVVASSVGVLTAGGVYLMLRLRAFPVILGLAMLSYAVNVFLFSSGRLMVGAPPVLQKYGDPAYTDPLPQALVLTAIVISFGMTAVLVMIALGSYLESAEDSVNVRLEKVEIDEDDDDGETDADEAATDKSDSEADRAVVDGREGIGR